MVLEYRKRSGIAMNEVIIQAQDLVKIYKSKKGIFSSRKEEVKALDHVSFEIKKGQIVGLIGESGCGKTTVGKALLNLLPVDGGKVIFQGKCIYDMITMRYPDALATIEIGTTVDVEDEFVVIGTKGRVTIPNDWWNTGYFEAKIDDSKGLKRYCFNFEGNGLRYLLQELLIMISDERTECTRLFNEESETLADILEIINQRG